MGNIGIWRDQPAALAGCMRSPLPADWPRARCPYPSHCAAPRMWPLLSANCIKLARRTATYRRLPSWCAPPGRCWFPRTAAQRAPIPAPMWRPSGPSYTRCSRAANLHRAAWWRPRRSVYPMPVPAAFARPRHGWRPGAWPHRRIRRRPSRWWSRKRVFCGYSRGSRAPCGRRRRGARPRPSRDAPSAAAAMSVKRTGARDSNSSSAVSESPFAGVTGAATVTWCCSGSLYGKCRPNERAGGPGTGIAGGGIARGTMTNSGTTKGPQRMAGTVSETGLRNMA